MPTTPQPTPPQGVTRPVHGTTAASRVLHRVDRVTSRASVAWVVAAVVVVYFLVATVVGFSEDWLTAFHTGAAALTLVMVFVIQHTQSREQAATQLKLDELIRASPRADDHFVHIEAAADHEINARVQRHLEHHGAVREAD
jgi:low affinity Fe/Cu permease